MDRAGAHVAERRPVETERVILEPVAAAHADGLYEAIVSSRKELLPWMPWALDPTPDGSREQAARSESDWHTGTRYHFALVERETGLVLGVAGFNMECTDGPELHYWIRTDHARRGLTTEGARALIDWASRELRVHRITLWAGRDNTPSRRVAEKLGFTHVGPLSWRPEGGMGKFEAESYELRV
jgi:RimJ/RimL family protein N-acetyltransferase